jgi:hypothetical protein
VLADGKVVGRIYEDGSASTPPELRWFWSVTAIVPAVPNRTNRQAATLDEAKAKFREAWQKAKASPEAFLSYREPLRAILNACRSAAFETLPGPIHR